jgi:dGTPase
MAAGDSIIDRFPDLKKADISAYDFSAVVAAASVAHDIGNPPFGHSGEAAIRDFFLSNEGMSLINGLSPSQQLDLQTFEGNAMGFRLMAYTLPGVSGNEGGLNLTYATLGTFSKYPCEVMADRIDGASSKKHGFFQSQKELFIQIADKLGMVRKTNPYGAIAFYRHPLAFLVEAADDISYLLMDYEDGYNLNLVSQDDIEGAFHELLIKECSHDILEKTYDKRERVAFLRANAISSLNRQINEVFNDNIDKIMEGNYDTPLSEQITKASALKTLKSLCKEHVYNYRKVLEIESAGFEVIGGLLSAFLKALRHDSNHAKKIKSLLSPHYILKNYEAPDQWYEAILHIVQFIAGMTDTFAIDTYRAIKGIKLPNY